jgi:hypothetical protein
MAVNVKIVVWLGKIVAEPASPVLPIPGTMVTDVAETVVQFRLEPWPAWMAVGDALNVITGGPMFTVTVVLAVTVPPLPVIVMVYVVVAVGETALVPFKATIPMPWLMEALVALPVVHTRVDV